MLDVNCKRRLEEVTVKALQSLKTEHGIFKWLPSTLGLYIADQSLPSSGKLRSKLETYISERPFHEFSSDFLSRYLYDKCEYSQDKGPHAFVPVGEDIETLSKRIVESFDSLPFNYEFAYLMPESLGELFMENLGPTEFSSSFALRSLEDYTESRPLDAGSRGLNHAVHGAETILGIGRIGPTRYKPWPRGASVLVLKEAGYVSLYSETEPVHLAMERITAFFGLCIALNILWVDRRFEPAPPVVHLYAFKEEGSRHPLARVIRPEASLAKVLSELRVAVGVKDAEPQVRQGYFRYLGLRVAHIFSDVEKYARIISASRWLLSSYAATDELLAFVQSTVVLEILLGEQRSNEKIGLTELLKNRCAYLIAESDLDREQIKAKFAEIYEVRSRIVHTGKSRLSRHESALLSEARGLGTKVIRREIELAMPR